MDHTILVVDDDYGVRSLLSEVLTDAGYHVLTAADGEAGLASIRSGAVDLLILDLNLPRMSGLEVCRQVREHPLLRTLPVLMLSIRDRVEDRILGLETGADDYLVKPFDVSEVVARVAALLRRTQPQAGAAKVLRTGQILLDRDRHRVTCHGLVVDLTATEFRLLEAFMEKPGRVWTREMLTDLRYGENGAATDRSVDVHVVNLRRKLGGCGAQIETVRGVGYRVNELPQTE